VSALNTVSEMVVPATTGWPAELIRNVPAPLYAMLWAFLVVGEI